MTNIRISVTAKQVEPPPPPPVNLSLWQYGDDPQVLGGIRTCAYGGCPAVMILRDAADTFFDKYWQFFLYAIDMGMSLAAILALLSKAKALFNSGGLDEDSDPRANYLTGSNLTYKPPRLDKLRTFALNTHEATEVYSLTFAIQSVLQSMQERSFTALKTSLVNFTTTNALQVKTFDGNAPPPLKPGRVQPERLEDVNPEDYLITPQSARWMFLDCTNVKVKPGNFLAYGPFANGLIRDWIGDGKMHTFFPLVSTTRILSPKKNWNKVSTFPSPFRQ